MIPGLRCGMVRWACGLVFLAVWVPLGAWGASPTSPAPVAEAGSNSTLVQGYSQWHDLIRRIESLESENRGLESRSDPEREDRNWWNPFWRTSAEHRLQRANEISLQVRDLEKQRLDLENTLLPLSAQVLQRARESGQTLAEADLAFNLKLDQWRIPLCLAQWNELSQTLGQLQNLSPELQARRLQALEKSRQAAKTLDDYLTWRIERCPPVSPDPAPQFRQWQKAVQAWLTSTAVWLKP